MFAPLATGRPREALVRDLRVASDPADPARRAALAALCALWRGEGAPVRLLNVWGVDLSAEELAQVVAVLEEVGARELMVSARLPAQVLPRMLCRTLHAVTIELDTSEQAQVVAEWIRENPLGPLRKLIMELSVVQPDNAAEIFDAAQSHATLTELSMPDSVMVGHEGARAAGRLLARNPRIKRTRLEYMETGCRLQCVAAREYLKEVAMDADPLQRTHRQALVFTCLGISIAMVSRLGIEDTTVNRKHRYRVFALAMAETSGWTRADSRGEAHVRLPLDQITQTVATQMGFSNDMMLEYFDFISDDDSEFGGDDELDDQSESYGASAHTASSAAGSRSAQSYSVVTSMAHTEPMSP